MSFRLRAFGWHLLTSAGVIALVLGVMYLGWYRWPGWYLTGAAKIALMIAGVALVLGPVLTLVIADPNKPRRELIRDIAIIVVVQLAALIYGSSSLWLGRPLYYAYSEKSLEIVQAAELTAAEIARARQENPAFAPHWYSLPRWVWAPLPADARAANDIVRSAIAGGTDVTQMPRYFRPYERAQDQMRARLRAVDAFGEFSPPEKKRLREKMIQLGWQPDQPVGMVAFGRVRPLLVVFDPQTMQIRAWLRAD